MKPSSQSTIAFDEFEVDRTRLHTAAMLVGSLVCHLHFERKRHVDMLATLLKTRLMPLDHGPAGQADVEVLIYERDASTPLPLYVDVSSDRLIVRRDGPLKVIHTEALSAYLFTDRIPHTILMPITNVDMPGDEQLIHLAVVFNKLLFLLERAILHAAGVNLVDSVSLFIGDNLAGKTTIALRLAQAGGVVLSDDRVLVRRERDRFVASGCDETGRITAKTERFVFSEPLPIEAQPDGKKDFVLGDFFEANPYQDYKIDRLFFSHVGAEFKITPLSAQAALLRMIHKTRSAHRFADAEDYTNYLDYFSELVEARPSFDLELGENLSDLDRLASFLRVQTK